MKRKERYIVRPDEVTITREGDYAVIQYKEVDVPATHLKIGPEVAGMSDAAIVELFNDTLRAQTQLAAEYKHVAVEVPLGSPQIKYSARCDQWVSRSGVLRCLIEDDENRQLVVGIDDHELSLEQFGRMLTIYAGWGMRIEFVPEDQLHRRPVCEVREPPPDGEA
jgi:pyridoxine 5'-phosphate synthase PdxJ